jgi:hypothetical protein
MCGIFGVFSAGDGPEPARLHGALRQLARLSESRGKDASGLVFRNVAERQFLIVKGAVPLRDLLETEEVRRPLERLRAGHSDFAVMGHARLVTNGSQTESKNNQPLVTSGIIGIHNGIIVNDRELWSRHPELAPRCEIDTEVMLALVRAQLRDGWDLATAVARTANEIFGSFAVALLPDDMDRLVLATNTGSLYYLSIEGRYLAFASEEYFLKKLSRALAHAADQDRVRQVTPGTGVVLDLERFVVTPFSFSDEPRRAAPAAALGAPFRSEVINIENGAPQRQLILDPAGIAARPYAAAEAALLEYNAERIQALRRCSKCILPATFPFIDFDAAGVCNYCRGYRIRNQPKPIEELFELVAPYRSRDGRPDCIIPYSGGRDSTHTLHIAKNVLKLHPIAFTYDWGMVTDLARRNIARVCGKLGVDNILVAADIAWKRENIRKNITAWLKQPHLGMVPLFMAGDKYFFHYTDRVKRQTGIRLNLWGINPLENTDFKVGFLGVPPDFNKQRIYSLSVLRQLKLLRETARILWRNPSYLNQSVWDTAGSYVSRSIVPHRDYYHLYDYYRWDEQEIETLVIKEYEWEMAVDTRTTWRIGDGTAPFYNYIYYTVAGFSEYETFRSNQIREGVMSRDEALRLVQEENRPRYPSIKWYTSIVNLDFADTIKRINAIPKLY